MAGQHELLTGVNHSLDQSPIDFRLFSERGIKDAALSDEWCMWCINVDDGGAGKRLRWWASLVDPQGSQQWLTTNLHWYCDSPDPLQILEGVVRRWYYKRYGSDILHIADSHAEFRGVPNFLRWFNTVSSDGAGKVWRYYTCSWTFEVSVSNRFLCISVLWNWDKRTWYWRLVSAAPSREEQQHRQGVTASRSMWMFLNS